MLHAHVRSVKGCLLHTVRKRWFAQGPSIEDDMLWSCILVGIESYRQKFNHVRIPSKFTIENSTEWPHETWNLNLGEHLKVIRENAKKDLLPDDRRLQLEALGVDLNGRITWQNKLLALTTYHAIHGNMNIPIAFQVPNDDKQWPKILHGLNLGKLVNGLRFRRENLSPERLKQLDALNFVWSSWDLSWRNRYQALSTYRRLYGNLNVPQGFIVPVNDPSWPEETWDMKLSIVVANLRKRSERLNFEQLEALQDLDFTWDKLQYNFKTRADAWKLYEKLHGTKEVPSTFVVPNTRTWPPHMWSLPLGRAVAAIHDKPSRLTLQQLSYLHDKNLLTRSLIDVIG